MFRGLARRMLTASAVVAVVIATAFAVLPQKIDNMGEWTQAAGDSQEILATAQELEKLVFEVNTDEQGFLLTADTSYLGPWQAAQTKLPALGSKLLRLARLPIPAAYSRRVLDGVASYIKDYSVPLVAAARAHDPAVHGFGRIAEGKRRIDAIKADFDGLDSAERALVAFRHEQVLKSGRIAKVAVVAGLVGSLLLILLFATYLSRVMVQPIRRAAKLARALTDGELSARMPETGIGEIGGLEKSFNVMARSLEVSSDDLRRLADEQAALRRVATLVARGQPPAVIFNAVTVEVASLLEVTEATMFRFVADGSTTVAASWGTRGEDVAQPAVSAPIIVNGNVWGRLTAASVGRAPLAVEAETRIANFTDLVATAIANSDARTELAASRARIVSATDQTRRRIERDLHDGTQQRLVSLALDLRIAEAEIPDELPQLRSQLSRVADGLSGAMNDLREISRGIHPAILSEGGLEPALKALARRSAVPVELEVHLEARLAPTVEIAVYYVTAEALANCAKHARASRVTIAARVSPDLLYLSIDDDGVGGADRTKGSGLVGLIDRIEAFGGTVKITSPEGRGTTLEIRMPLDRSERPAF
jgi:signal transduction histidine kinase